VETGLPRSKLGENSHSGKYRWDIRRKNAKEGPFSKPHKARGEKKWVGQIVGGNGVRGAGLVDSTGVRQDTEFRKKSWGGIAQMEDPVQRSSSKDRPSKTRYIRRRGGAVPGEHKD